MSLSLRFYRPAPKYLPAAARGTRGTRSTPDRGVTVGVAVLVRRPRETSHIASGVVEADQERPQPGVPDDGERAGIDLDPLEQVEMNSKAIRNDRLDDISVRAHHVAGVPAQLRVPLAHRAHRAVLHLGQ